MLTLRQLKDMRPDTIFASGFVTDDPAGINMTGSGKPLKWVATRGGIHDWAIYIGHAARSDQNIKSLGDKVHYDEHIRELVPCDDEAFAMYRH